MQPAHALAAAVVSVLVITGLDGVPALAGVFERATADPERRAGESAGTASSADWRPAHAGERARTPTHEDVVIGLILAFDKVNLTIAGVDTPSSTATVTSDTVVKVKEASPDSDDALFDRGSLAHLAVGVAVADLEVDLKTGVLEEIAVYRQG